MTIRLDEDWHVHSTFSDGVDTIAANIAVAESLGLGRLGCVDHVRRDSTYVSDYVVAVREAREHTAVELTIGIEAKILDVGGALDLPALVDGVDHVYVADHQFPGDTGPISPRLVRLSIEQGERSAASCVDQIVRSTIAAMRAHSRSGPTLVLAHLFSILPKLGLSESLIDDEALESVAAAAAATETIVEISERWRCPSLRMIECCLRAGVRVVASTDSHRAADIAQYSYVRNVVAAL